MKNKNIFKCLKNNIGFISYHNRSNKEIKPQNIRELYKILIPICIENDEKLLKQIKI